jgi:hypothetical protein
VEGAGGRVIFVELTCPEPEIERRIEESSRARYGKLRSKTLYRELREAGAFEYAKLPAGLTIDTSASTAEQAARRIASHFGIP